MYSLIAQILVAVLTVVGIFSAGHLHGKLTERESHFQAAVDTTAKLQDVAEQTTKTVVVEKEKLVTKYKPIYKEVVKYVESDAAKCSVDPEFIRLFNQSSLESSPTNPGKSD